MNAPSITRTFAATALAAAVTLSALPVRTHASVAPRNLSAPSVVQGFVRALDAANATGDFSALAPTFAPNATLHVTMPGAPTVTFHGRTAIMQFYNGLHAKAPNFQWTIVSLQALTKNVVMTYDQAGTPSNRALGSCVHVYVVKSGEIVNYNWVVYR